MIAQSTKSTFFGALQTLFAALIVLFSSLISLPAFAIEPIAISEDQIAISLNGVFEIHEGEGAVSIDTAPDKDGVVQRIQILSSRDAETAKQNPTKYWASFALANPSDVQIDRLIVAERYRQPNSGVFWPDLGSQRIYDITPSTGFSLQRVENLDADVFLLTIDPGAIVTFVAELNTDSLPSLTVWEPDAYEATINSYTLYHGMVLGIAGLLALFITILFIIKGSVIFPTTAFLAWSVLAYVAVDFGFVSDITGLSGEPLKYWRSAAEICLAAGLLMFTYFYLHINRWSEKLGLAVLIWLGFLVLLLFSSYFAPEVAAGLARLSFATTLMLGTILLGALMWKRYDRAFMLVPAWALCLFWVAGGFLTATGALDNDIVQSALTGGLVLIIMLLNFIVMQQAFSGGSVFQGFMSDTERQALALMGAGDGVWDWDLKKDKLFASPDIAAQLGKSKSEMSCLREKWLDNLHPDDRDRFQATLDMIVEHRRGRIAQDFKLQAEDGSYRIYRLRARPVIGDDDEVLRCVGTLLDVTGDRQSNLRLLHDAIHDTLTGLPNAQLLVDRLSSILSLSRSNADIRPTVLVIEIDNFARHSSDLGPMGTETLLLSLARRLEPLVETHDTLARLEEGQFAILLSSASDPDALVKFLNELKKTIRIPVDIEGKKINLTASVGLASQSTPSENAEDLMKNANLALYQAKRLGGNRIEPFRPAFRVVGTNSNQMELELHKALEKQQIEIHFQPIISLENHAIAGFEALMRWKHPRLGYISPDDFIPIAERSNLILPMGLYALQSACRMLSYWQEKFNPDLFVSVNISSRQIFSHTLLQDFKDVLDNFPVNEGTLKLELTESLVMSDPEYAKKVMEQLKKLGASLSLDDFGTGYSSLSYLIQFPFDTLKVDKTFVRKASETNNKSVILRAIVNLAHDLGLSVVAEGAEEESDVLELAQLQCEYVQGYLFGKAMNVTEATKLLVNLSQATTLSEPQTVVHKASIERPAQ